MDKGSFTSLLLILDSVQMLRKGLSDQMKTKHLRTLNLPSPFKSTSVCHGTANLALSKIDFDRTMQYALNNSFCCFCWLVIKSFQVWNAVQLITILSKHINHRMA